MRNAEWEKARRRVGIADRKVFARLESFCAYLQNWLKINSKHSISLEGFQTVWKYKGQCEKFPEGVESFHTAWKIFGQSGEFLNTLESFWRVWKVSRQSRNFPDSLKNFLDSLEKAWTVWKVSGKPGKFLDNLEGLQPICKRQRYRVFFVTVAPPKGSKYIKVNLG